MFGLFRLLGGVSGWIFGGPLGFAIGWGVGSFIDTKMMKQQGAAGTPPDPHVTSTTEGQIIPRVWGLYRVGAMITWARDLTWTTRTLLRVYATFTAGLCEGQISGVRRIWAGGKCRYDDSNANAAQGTQEFRKYVTVYNGSRNQSPDITLKMDKYLGGGAVTGDDVPSYSGMAYLRFLNLYLKDYYNRIPTDLSAEIVGSGTTTPINWAQVATPAWSARSLAGVTFVPDKEYVYIIGGWNGDGAHFDCYRTANGMTWNACASPSEPRYDFDAYAKYLVRLDVGDFSSGDLREYYNGDFAGWYVFCQGGADADGTIPLRPGFSSETKCTGALYSVERDSWALLYRLSNSANPDTQFNHTLPFPRSGYATTELSNYTILTGGNVVGLDAGDNFPEGWLDGTGEAGTSAAWRHAYDNTMCDTWITHNGFTWTEVFTASQQYEFRRNHAMVTHQDEAYLCGGIAIQYTGGMGYDSQFSNALYRFVVPDNDMDEAQWSRVNKNVACYTPTITHKDVGAKKIYVSGDYSTRIVPGGVFRIYSTTGYPTVLHYTYAVESVSYNAFTLTTAITVTGASPAIPSTLAASAYVIYPIVEATAAAFPEQGCVYGCVSWGGYLVCAIQVEGYPLQFVFSDDRGANFERLTFSATLPTYSGVNAPELNFVTAWGAMWLLGGENTDYVPNNDVWRSTYELLNPSDVPLSTIVEDVCELCGLSSDQVDASDLDSVSVTGCAMTTTPRQFIEDLQRCFFFDKVQSGWKLKFKIRGGESVATITEDDLSAHDPGSASPPYVEITRQQELEAPYRINVSYPDSVRDHSIRTQSAERIDTDSKKVVNISFPITMDADKAAQVAWVLLWDAWNERLQVGFSTNIKYLYLEPGDVVTLHANDDTYIVRITRITYQEPGILRFNGVIEDLELYSAEPGGVESEGGEPVTYTTPTLLYKFLDIPLLRSTHKDDYGFYLAVGVAPGDEDLFSGADIYRQVTGSLYEIVAVADFIARMGTTTTALPDTTDVYPGLDEDSEVNFDVESGEFVSSDDYHYAAIGSEVVKIKTIKEDYTEDNLIVSAPLYRGLYGTASETSGHAIGDDIVILDRGDVVRVPLDDEESIGEALLYKIVPRDVDPDTVAPIEFTCSAVSKLPYPVTDLTATRLGTSGYRLEWYAQSRLDAPSLDESDFRFFVEVWYDGSSAADQSHTLVYGTDKHAPYEHDIWTTEETLTVKVWQLTRRTVRGRIATLEVTP